jgi:hypothetical protein
MNSFLGIPMTESRIEIRPSGQEINVVCYALTKDLWPSVLSKLNTILTKSQKLLLDGFSKNKSKLISD